MRSFAIFEIRLTNARSALKRPFRIMETYMTLDGYRARICDGHWETFDEANKYMGEMLDKQGLELEFFSSYDYLGNHSLCEETQTQGDDNHTPSGELKILNS